MDGELMKWLATLGVGGVLAGVMFGFYRKDTREWREEMKLQRDYWRNQSEIVLLVVKENTASNATVSKGIEANTRMVEMLCHQIFGDEVSLNEGRRRFLRAAVQVQATGNNT